MSQAVTPLKKDEKPLVVFLRIYAANKARLLKVCRHTGLDHNAIGLAGTLAEIERLEQHLLPVTPAELKAIASFKKVTGDASIVPTLSAAMRDSVLREKSAPVHTAQQSTAA